MNFTIPPAYRDWLKVGASSWKFDSWKGLVYGADKKYRPDDYLSDYARLYSTVEVDQWFWSLFPGGVKLPDRETARKYAASTPEDFTFTVKAPNSLTLTHYYNRQPVKHRDLAGKPNPHFLDPGLLEDFLERLEPLGPRLGPVMFQFEYLNQQKFSSRAEFEDRLGGLIQAAPSEYRYAVEIRNPKWLTRDFFGFLKSLDLGFVYLEGYYMDPIGEVFEKHHPLTADFAVVRLHGGDRAEIEKATGEMWNRLVEPRPASREAALKIVRHHREHQTLTYLNVNNHFEGSAPLSIDLLLTALAQSP